MLNRTRSLRADELALFERLAAAVAVLTDDELEQLIDQETSRLRDRRIAPPFDRVMDVEMLMTEVLTGEKSRRQGVMWDSQAEMQDGHMVTLCEDRLTFGTWQAVCSPRSDGEVTCWVGPERTHREDAAEDARRHSGFEAV